MTLLLVEGTGNASESKWVNWTRTNYLHCIYLEQEQVHELPGLGLWTGIGTGVVYGTATGAGGWTNSGCGSLNINMRSCYGRWRLLNLLSVQQHLVQPDVIMVVKLLALHLVHPMHLAAIICTARCWILDVVVVFLFNVTIQICHCSISFLSFTSPSSYIPSSMMYNEFIPVCIM